jgi:hypothetical protein
MGCRAHKDQARAHHLVNLPPKLGLDRAGIKRAILYLHCDPLSCRFRIVMHRDFAAGLLTVLEEAKGILGA